MRELTIENSLAEAVNIFCMLESKGVTYCRVSELDEVMRRSEPKLKDFVIEAHTEVKCSVSNDPYPGWKPPGNYHHRRGHR